MDLRALPQTARAVFRQGPLSSRILYGLLVAAFLVMPMGTSPYTIAGVCILAVWILSGAFIRRSRAWLHAHWIGPVLALVLLHWAGLIYSPDAAGLGLQFAGKSYYWLYALALAGLGLSSRGVDLLLSAFLLGLAINACVGFMQAAGWVPELVELGDHAFIGLYGGHNTLSVLLVLGMLTTAFYFRKADDRRGRAVFAGLFVVYFLHLVIMESRGGYLTFFVLCPLILHQGLGGRSWRRVALVFLLVIGLMFTSSIVRERAAGTLKELGQRFQPETSEHWGRSYSRDLPRVYYWWWSVELFKRHPVLGVGTGGYREAMTSAGGEVGVDHPHNNLLYLAVSFGVPGVVVFCWLFWVLLRVGWKHRREALGFFTLSAVLVILVGGLTETHLVNAGGIFLLAVSAGLQCSLPTAGTGTLRQQAEGP